MNLFPSDAQELLERFYRFSDFEKRREEKYTSENYHLKTITELLDKLGNPQNDYETIHIAGTKGKGSVTHYMAHALELLGVETGHTLSPQIIDERDRFYLRGERVSWDVLYPIFEKVLEVVETHQLTPTVFDLYTASAFLLFQQAKIRIAVVETGMGGRWDSTNVIQSRCSIITLIDFDHMDKLGDSLVKIAGEKVGIIKSGQTVYYLAQDEKVNELIEEVAVQKSAKPVAVTNFHPSIEKHWNALPDCSDLDLVLNSNSLLKSNLALKTNLNLVTHTLLGEGFLKSLDEVWFSKVVAAPTMLGRMQLVDHMLFDGAHTPRSMTNLVNIITACFPNRKVRVFFYCMVDKDAKSLLEIIPKNWELHWLDPELFFIPQPLVKKLCEKVEKIWKERTGQTVKVDRSSSIKNILNEIHLEKQTLNQPHLNLFTGSFRLIGWVLKSLETL